MCRFFVCLIFTALPRRKSLLSIHAWTNIHATIPQIVGLLLRSAQFYSFFRTMQATRKCVPLFFSQKHTDFVRKNKSPSKNARGFCFNSIDYACLVKVFEKGASPSSYDTVIVLPLIEHSISSPPFTNFALPLAIV